MEQKVGTPMLGPYRALDLTDERGYFCGKVLADLGADVIKIEPPGGDPSRNIGPFYHDIPEPEKSLFWFAYNQGKRGITLNLEAGEGREIFRRLAPEADLVIESFAPGYMDGLGLGYPDLREINPAIIVTSITPFGQGGPYRDYRAPDMVGMALGGLMYLCGDADRPPVRLSAPQAYLHAGGEAAVASLIALYHRTRTGEGQRVDVSMQQSVVNTTMNSRPFRELCGTVLTRQGPYRSGLSSGAVQRQTWPCKDGAVTFVIMGGAGGAKTNRALVEWMDGEGMADDSLKNMDWDNFDMATASQEFHDHVDDLIGRFFRSHTKAELYEGARTRRIMLYPVATIEDTADSPQLAARDFWVEVEHPELGRTITYPGPFVWASQTPLHPGRRAPLIGAHNEEVYCRELGLPS
ncbi:MAG: CaiB/BaiF CoA transferase family protein, partial [Dehalococcoidia bacterium]